MSAKTLRQFSFVSTLACTFFLIGCGSGEVKIADKTKVRVDLAKKTVQMSFVLNSKYQVQASASTTYDKLGKVFLTWSADTKTNEVGAKVSGDKSIIEGNWPIKDFSQLPDGSDLPDAVPSKTSLRLWPKTDGHLEMDLLYAESPALVSAGAILSDQFKTLPEGFYAYQNFRATNGDVIASIVALGPSSNIGFSGGLYFFSNFGVDPFEDQAIQQLAAANSNQLAGATVAEWEIAATDSAEILSYGETWAYSWFFSLEKWLQAFTTEVQNYNPL